MNVFVCHSNADGERVDALVALMREAGCPMLYSRTDIQAGDDFAAWMNESLGKATHMPVVWSEAASQSDHVNNEWRAFYALHPKPGRQCFLRLDSAGMPGLMAARHWLRWEHGEDAGAVAARLLDWLGFGRRGGEQPPDDREGPPPPGQPQPPIGGADLDPRVEALRQFPLGPLVPGNLVPLPLKREHGRHFTTMLGAKAAVLEASSIVVQADPGARAIEEGQFPVGEVTMFDFWFAMFQQACLYGPRMVAALLMAVPHDQFPPEQQTLRARLMQDLARFGQ